MKIEELLETKISRGNCEKCKLLFKDFDGTKYCGVTEEKIGSGDEYCELKPL